MIWWWRPKLEVRSLIVSRTQHINKNHCVYVQQMWDSIIRGIFQKKKQKNEIKSNNFSLETIIHKLLYINYYILLLLKIIQLRNNNSISIMPLPPTRCSQLTGIPVFIIVLLLLDQNAHKRDFIVSYCSQLICVCVVLAS